MATTTCIPLTARAALLTAFNQEYVLKPDHPVKQPSELAPGECLIKIEYAGCCHSDLHIRQGDWGLKQLPLPLIPGHEGVGHVIAIGEHTFNSDIKIGDRVGCKWTARACLRYVAITLARKIKTPLRHHLSKMRDVPKRRGILYVISVVIAPSCCC